MLPTTTSLNHFDKYVGLLHQIGKQKWIKIKLPENIDGEIF